jgi:hypothetical protein
MTQTLESLKGRTILVGSPKSVVSNNLSGSNWRRKAIKNFQTVCNGI